ncbi:MAG: amidohydrolase family protein [Planctomycetes bacterium]|nr:amidohydrolase family protein [Planctomycetota bacterium]
MATNLALHIQQLPLCDSHEHLRKEKDYVENGPDILQNLFGNYVQADLVVGGASTDAVNRLLDAKDPDIRSRFDGVRRAWERVRHTGYGEAVRTIASQIYGLEEITAAGLEAALPRHQELRQPGQRLRILRERANLDHVQVDDFCWPCLPDESGLDFFFYDLSWVSFCSGTPDFKALGGETGIEVKDLSTLRQAMRALFDKYARYAIAIKSQHAYNRTLLWRERTDSDAARALEARLSRPDQVSEDERLCLGDWCWARGVELGIEHDLPFKIHTGYYAGHSSMPVDFIRGGNLCSLLKKYPKARFVLMHIAYPYNDELVALAKHYPNVYADLCWAWSIDPYSSADFLRRCLHAVPINKIFAFGGDTAWPCASMAYALQARRWLTVALEREIAEEMMTEREAVTLATHLMSENQYDCFHLEDKRSTIVGALETVEAPVLQRT